MNIVRSMTGYGKAQYSDDNKIFTVEIKTVNNRYSDIIVKIPKHLRLFEDSIRKIVKKQINRGRVEVYISVEYIAESEMEIIPNIELAKSYKKAIREIRDILEIEKEAELDTFFRFQDILTIKRKEVNEDDIRMSLENATYKAIEQLIKMRNIEGEELKKDITLNIEKIKGFVNSIENHCQKLVDEYKEKLQLRINELLGDKYELDENRLYNEIVFYADKSDINEEIVRLNSHIDQVFMTLNKGGVIGRKLDFIIQEANREINTIGSKIGNLDIIKYVVEVKNLLEKIREQTQNIE